MCERTTRSLFCCRPKCFFLQIVLDWEPPMLYGSVCFLILCDSVHSASHRPQSKNGWKCHCSRHFYWSQSSPRKFFQVNLSETQYFLFKLSKRIRKSWNSEEIRDIPIIAFNFANSTIFWWEMQFSPNFPKFPLFSKSFFGCWVLPFSQHFFSRSTSSRDQSQSWLRRRK